MKMRSKRAPRRGSDAPYYARSGGPLIVWDAPVVPRPVDPMQPMRDMVVEITRLMLVRLRAIQIVGRKR